MSVVGEIGLAIGVVAVVAQVVSAYRDGGGIIDRIKEKRAAKRARPLPVQLEYTVKDTPDDIEREKNRGLTRFGESFAHGDYIAILTIQQITIQIQTSFLAKLRNAFDDTTDLTALVNDADMGRDGTLRALIELQQRLMTAAPLSSTPQLTHAQTQPTFQPWGPSFGTTQLLPSNNTNTSTSGFPTNEQRSDSVMEAAQTTRRTSGFRPFRRSRQQSQGPTGLQDQTLVDQDGPRRIFTILTNSSNEGNHSTLEHATTMNHLNGIESQNHTTVLQRTISTGDSFRYSYESWEDNPAEIWGSPRSPGPSTQLPNISIEMPAPSRTTTSQSSGSSTSIPHPNPTNNYLGFCKGAWKLQDGDRNAMVKSADYTQSAQSKRKFLRCCKCDFEGHFNPDTIWNTIFKFDAMKIRWSFLAKSHVQQRSPQNRALARKCDFTYQCIFCAFLGCQQAAMHGAKAYRDHIYVQHYGTELSELVLYKAACVNDRVCDDSEDFDINLYPRVSELS